MTTDPHTMGKHAPGKVRDAMRRYEEKVAEHNGSQERDWGEFEVDQIRRTCDRLEAGPRTEKRAEDITYIQKLSQSLLRKARKLEHDVEAQGQ